MKKKSASPKLGGGGEGTIRICEILNRNARAPWYFSLALNLSNSKTAHPPCCIDNHVYTVSLKLHFH